MTEVYVALGGNIGDPKKTLQHALKLISEIDHVQLTAVSRFYLTTPVSDIPQPSYVNAVCKCETSLSAADFFQELQQIETFLGKTSKAKNAPRSIDLDILFFGTEKYHTPTLEIPHPRWKERLFVLKPLSELTTEIFIPTKEGSGHDRINLIQYLQTFRNPHQEVVKVLHEESNSH